MEILKDNGMSVSVETGKTIKRTLEVKCSCGAIFTTDATRVSTGKVTACKACTFKRIGTERAAKAATEFETKAKLVHGDTYLYNTTVYKSVRTPILVTCKIHGEFSITPTQHLTDKSGCPECNTYNKRLTTKEFSSYVNENAPDYEVHSQYKNALTKITMKHKICGHKWEITPNKFKMGRRCPKCMLASDYDTIYIWRVNSTDIYKIGVTSQRLGTARIHQVAKDAARACGVLVEAHIELIFKTQHAKELETILHKKYTSIPTGMPDKMDGYTEFKILNTNELTEAISYIINFKTSSTTTL